MLNFDFGDPVRHRLTPERLKKRKEEEEQRIRHFWEGQEMIRKLGAELKAEKEASGKNDD